MKKPQNNSQNKELIDTLKSLTRRVEEATVDIHEMKSDLKMVSLSLSNVESNTKITKVDIEKIREEINDLTGMTSEILAKMVTQKEFKNLYNRVTLLEQPRHAS